MSLNRRREDGLSWIVRYWMIIAFVVTWLVGGLVGFVHLEDHVLALQKRADWHWGSEW